jgi:hypothetical protein
VKPHAPAAQERTRRGRARLASLALLAVSALVSLAAAELLLRVSGGDTGLWAGFAPHEELGWTFVPGRDAAAGRLTTNRLGFRDVDHERAKPAGTRRLIVLGDSYTAATQVPLDRTYPRLLQRLLEEQASDRWEVISLAVNGWGTVQEWLALERYGLAYAPDLVLLQFFPNDICNNAPSAADYCAFHDEMRPYALEDGDDLRVVWREPLRRRLRLDSALFRVAERGFESLRLRWREGSAAALESADEVRLKRTEQAARLDAELGIVMHPFFYAYAPAARQIAPVAEGWRVTERIVERMAGSLRRAGIGFGLVVMPYEAAVDPEAWDAMWHTDPPPPVALERDQPERRLGALGERVEIPVLSLLGPFEQNRSLVLPYRKYHLNLEGHRIAAEALYGWLLAERMITAREE